MNNESSNIKPKWHNLSLKSYWANKPYPVQFPLLTNIFKPSLLEDYNTTDYYNLIAAIFAQHVLYCDGEYSQKEQDAVIDFFKQFYTIKTAEKIDRLIKQYSKRDQFFLFDSILYDVNQLYTVEMKRSLIHLLFTIIKADDEIKKVELSTLFKLMRKLNFSYREINSITALYIENYVPYPFVSSASAKEKMYGTRQKTSSKKKKTKTSNRKRTYTYLKNQSNQYYLILGISNNATVSQIKKAYRLKVKENHPDLFRNASEFEQRLAKDRIRKINKAYEELQRIKKFN